MTRAQQGQWAQLVRPVSKARQVVTARRDCRVFRVTMALKVLRVRKDCRAWPGLPDLKGFRACKEILAKQAHKVCRDSKA